MNKTYAFIEKQKQVRPQMNSIVVRNILSWQQEIQDMNDKKLFLEHCGSV